MINDAGNNEIHENIHCFKYVDDLTMVECREQNVASNQLQQTVSNLCTWAENNKMQLNPTKCFKMELSFSRNPPNRPPITIGDHQLCTERETKLLGVHIQNDLKWESHIRNIEKRANAKLYMLRLVRQHELPRDDLITIFIGYIRPIMEYAAPVWSGGITLNQSDRLERIQKRALRIVLRNDYSTYNDALDICGLKSLQDRRKDLCITFFEKNITNKSLQPDLAYISYHSDTKKEKNYQNS